ncbi:MAG: hypothetical protein IT379_33205 [Deltaproteobacteria bacterium]|nr:hypothetical protein [Deltaproteobacteria bacterium]
MSTTDSYALLEVLTRHRVTFVVVGMTAAVLQGAPTTTIDLDILYLLSEENVERLLAALEEIDAEFRGDLAGRRLRPNTSHLASPGHKLLRTRLGQLDALGTIEEATRYEDVADDVIRLEVGGLSIEVLGLARLIVAKERAGRPKDLAVLPLLRATLDEAAGRSDQR